MSIRSFLGGLLVGVALVEGVSVLAAENPVIKGDSGRLEGVEVLKGGKRFLTNRGIMPLKRL